MTPKRPKAQSPKQSAKRKPRADLPPLVPQPGGRGAIYRGGVPGNAGGGRPRDAVRAKLLHLAEGKGVPFLDDLMDGKVSVQFLGTCPACHVVTALPQGDDLHEFYRGVLTIVGRSVEQRLRGSEQTLKYGLGTKDEVEVTDSPRVQTFLRRLYQIVEEVCGPERVQQIAQQVSTYQEGK